VSQTAIASVTYAQSAIDIADHSVAQCFTHSRDTALTLTALSQQIAHDTFTQHVLTITTIGLHNATARACTHTLLCTPLHIHLYIFMHIIAYTLIHIHAHQYINKHTDRQSCTPQYQQHCTHYSVWRTHHVHSQLLVYTQDKLHNNTIQSWGNSSHVFMRSGVLLPLSLQRHHWKAKKRKLVSVLANSLNPYSAW